MTTLTTDSRWAIGLVIGLIVQAAALVIWGAKLEAQVHQNQQDIAQVETRVDAINTDLRNILIGIEQVKTRLGIVEQKP